MAKVEKKTDSGVLKRLDEIEEHVRKMDCVLVNAAEHRESLYNRLCDVEHEAESSNTTARLVQKQMACDCDDELVNVCATVSSSWRVYDYKSLWRCTKCGFEYTSKATRKQVKAAKTAGRLYR